MEFHQCPVCGVIDGPPPANCRCSKCAAILAISNSAAPAHRFIQQMNLARWNSLCRSMGPDRPQPLSQWNWARTNYAPSVLRPYQHPSAMPA